MLDKVNLRKFTFMKLLTYKTLTLDFLSSLSIEVIRGRNASEGKISFRLFNNYHSFNLKELNHIFGWTNEGEKIVQKFSEYEPWMQFTSYVWDLKTKRSSHISKPCLKYMHHLLASSIFCRHESDCVVRSDEVLYMWSMLNPSAKLNNGSYFSRQLQRVANQPTCKISIGGYVTAVALHFGYNEATFGDEVGASKYLDLDFCVSMGMIELTEQCCYLLLPNSTIKVQLPFPAMTTVKDKRNWIIKALDNSGETIPSDHHTQSTSKPPPLFSCHVSLTKMAEDLTSLHNELKDQRSIIGRIETMVANNEHKLEYILKMAEMAQVPDSGSDD